MAYLVSDGGCRGLIDQRAFTETFDGEWSVDRMGLIVRDRVSKQVG
jgi:hypothetical protein